MYVNSLSGKRSEEMTQSNTSSPRGSEVQYLYSPRGGDGIEVSQNEEIFRGEKKGRMREKSSRFCYLSEKSEYGEH